MPEALSHSEHAEEPVAGAPPAEAEGEAQALTWWQRFSFGTLETVLWGMRGVMGLKGLYQFGRCFGTVEWLINYKRRRRFARALEGVLGRRATGSERRRYGREYCMRTRCAKMFFLIGARLGQEEAASRLTITNRDLLDDALACGHGVYLALSHQGDHHTVGMLLALAGYELAGVRDRPEPGLWRHVRELFIKRHPDVTLPQVLYATTFPRRIYRCYREGRVVISLMDVTTFRHGSLKTHTVKVFGAERKFLTGPLQIALRCRAPVVQAFLLPEPAFRYRLEVVGVLADPEAVQDEDEAVQAAVEAYASNLETYLRRAPSLISRI